MSSLREGEMKVKHMGSHHDIMYVNVFSETSKQFNGEHVIDMVLLGGKKTISSYYQHSQNMYFLQKFLSQSIVLPMLLLISAGKVVIDILFMVLQKFW